MILAKCFIYEITCSYVGLTCYYNIYPGCSLILTNKKRQSEIQPISDSYNQTHFRKHGCPRQGVRLYSKYLPNPFASALRMTGNNGLGVLSSALKIQYAAIYNSAILITDLIK